MLPPMTRRLDRRQLFQLGAAVALPWPAARAADNPVKMPAKVRVGLIGIELATTLWLIPLTGRLAAVAAVALLLFGGAYWAMSRCRRFWPVGLDRIPSQGNY